MPFNDQNEFLYALWLHKTAEWIMNIDDALDANVYELNLSFLYY